MFVEATLWICLFFGTLEAVTGVNVAQRDEMELKQNWFRCEDLV